LGSNMQPMDERHALFLQLLALPGAVKPTVWDDIEWAWDADPHGSFYIEWLGSIQQAGVFPDAEARLVRFNPALLIRSHPRLRPQFQAISELRPMSFSGRLPARPRPVLRLVG